MIEFSEIPSVALAIFAHPDDADMACGGTLAKWTKAGVQVTLVVCTKGDKGTVDTSISPNELTQSRNSEVAEGSHALGISEVIRLGIEDGEVQNDKELRYSLVELIRRKEPQVVLTPDPTAIFFGNQYFNHRDHRELGWAVLDSVSPAARLPHYFPTAGTAHAVKSVLLSGSLSPSHIVDISDEVDLKIKAVSCHRSQLHQSKDSLGEVISQRAGAVGEGIGRRFGEEFRVLSLASA